MRYQPGDGQIGRRGRKVAQKAVIAISTATYWYAMRANGMAGVIDGFGSLMTDFRELPSSYLRVAAEQEAADGI